jgi:hypothetical protein
VKTGASKQLTGALPDFLLKLLQLKDIPHWQLLVIFYLTLVAIPVYFIHIFLKKRAYANRTFSNLLLYFVGVVGTAFLMHSLCMWLYFSFFFQR